MEQPEIDVGLKCYKAGESPIIVAAKTGNLEAAKILIEKGADHGDFTTENITPLGYAARNGHLEVR